MRVLQLCNKAPYPPRDGGALASWNLARGLIKNGVQLTLLFMNTSRHYIPENEVPGPLEKSLQYIGIPVKTDIRLPALLWNLLFSNLPYNLSRFKSSAFKERIHHLLTGQEFDAVIFDGLPLALYLPLFQTCPKLQKILRAHNVEHRIWEDLAKTESSFLKKWYLKIFSGRIKKFEMESLHKMDALLPISRPDLEYFRKQGYKKPSFVLPFGIDPENYSSEKEKKQFNPNMLFLGAMDWKPNISGLKWFIKEVWPAVHQKHPDILFHIAGRNPGKKLEIFFDKPFIRFQGEIGETDSFLNQGDLFPVPLFAGSGMRVKIIEAMARGLVVITTSRGLEGIPAEPGKQVMVADTASAFINHLNKLLDHPELCLKISQDAQQFVFSNFNNFTLTRELTGFIKSQLQ